MKADKISDNLTLWRAARPFLPESIQNLRILRCTLKFRMASRGGMKAEVGVNYSEGDSYNYREGSRRADIADPYTLFNVLKGLISNWPDAATSLDLIIDPNGVAQVKTTYIPLLREEQ
jgi:hypothetical protein